MARGVGALVLALAGNAVRAEGPTLQVRVEGACPSLADVTREVGTLLPSVVLAPASAAGQGFVVRDQGGRYALHGASVERALLDPSRRCAHRARTIALLLALALRPPHVDEPIAPRAPPAPTPATPPPTSASPVPSPPPLSPPATAAVVAAAPTPAELPRPPRATSSTLTARSLPAGGLRVDLEVAAGFEAAPGAPGDSDRFGFAATLRVLAGWRHVALTFAVSGVSPTTLDLGRARARTTPLPIELGARLRLPLGTSPRPIALALDLGVEGRLLFASGDQLMTSRQGTTLLWGVRAAPVLELPIGQRWTLIATVPMRFFPSPAELVSAQTLLGTGPRFSVGFGLGVAFSLDGRGGR